MDRYTSINIAAHSDADGILAPDGNAAQNTDIARDGTGEADASRIVAHDVDRAKIGQIADQGGFDRNTVGVVPLDQDRAAGIDQDVARLGASPHDPQAIAACARSEGTVRVAVFVSVFVFFDVVGDRDGAADRDRTGRASLSQNAGGAVGGLGHPDGRATVHIHAVVRIDRHSRAASHSNGAAAGEANIVRRGSRGGGG
ncbi:hypothetical protein D3C87_1296790 [compost metagenome]